MNTTTDLSSDALGLRHGVRTNHEEMPNGELRFRLISADGSTDVRTVASEVGAWQKSHSHSSLQETYIVESGWMVIVELDDHDGLNFRMMGPSDVFTTVVRRKHNIYLPAGAVIHTVKHSAASADADWFPAPDLDERTLKLSESDVLLSCN